MTRKLLLALALTFGLCSTALADFYLGAKTGLMMADIEGADVDTHPTNVGVSLGYELGVLAGDLALEAEFTRTAAEGEVEGGGDIEVDSNAVYVAFTTAGPLYFKIRGGLQETEVRAGSGEENERGETFGVGVGFSLGLLRLEAELTSIDDDVNFVSIGVVF